MDTWLDRLIAEHQERAEQLDKLAAFIDGPAGFQTLDAVDQGLLIAQRKVMTQLVEILRARVEKHTPPAIEEVAESEE